MNGGMSPKAWIAFAIVIAIVSILLIVGGIIYDRIKKEMTDKIKLEDMTLAQIKNLKKRIIDEIYSAVSKETDGYDVGKTTICANVEPVANKMCEIELKNRIAISFSKEYD